MAILKEIILDSGIPVNYHRIVSVNNITNHSSVIEIGSYVSKNKRLEEKEKLANNETMNIFIHTSYINKEYTQNLNVVSAYDYIKTLEEFSGAVDDL